MGIKIKRGEHHLFEITTDSEAVVVTAVQSDGLFIAVKTIESAWIKQLADTSKEDERYSQIQQLLLELPTALGSYLTTSALYPGLGIL